MITNDELREEVRILKATHRIPFKTFAQANNLKVSSFYNWLRGDFDYTDNSCELVHSAVKRMKSRVSEKGLVNTKKGCAEYAL